MHCKSVRGAFLAALILATPMAAGAHSGHDHGEAAPPPPAVTAPGQGAEGAVFQVVLAPEGEGSLLYLADVDSNAPVAGAAIEIDGGGWRGRAEPTATEGVYRLAWKPPAEGADLTLIVTADGRDDLLLLRVPPIPLPAKEEPVAEKSRDWLAWAGAGGLLFLLSSLAMMRRRSSVAAFLAAWLAASAAWAHSGHDHGAPEPAPATAPGAAIPMPKASQFLLGLRTVRVEPLEVAESLRVVGHVTHDPAGFARVQPSQPARVVIDPSFAYPVPGQKVKRGDVLLVLEPTLTSLERSEKRGSLYRTESEIAILERDLARQEALGGVVPQKTIETTRIRLEQLRKERGQIAGTALGRELVTAPVDGIVTDVHVAPGEVVALGQQLVEIVDPARLRVEAIVHDLAAVDAVRGATAASRLLPGRSVPLNHLGTSPRIDPLDQGVHIHFSVPPEETKGLRIGMPVDVYLETGTARMRLAVPREAVVERGGGPVVFVRTAPETFEARPVRPGRTIGNRTEIEEGLRPGERVVTQGAQQLRAMR
jgi:RND family efflux transporter MFP subunit